MTDHKKFLSKAIFGIAFIILVFVIGYFFFFYQTISRPMHFSKKTTGSIKVMPGATIHQLARELYRRKLTMHPDFVTLYADIKGYSSRLRFGEYRLYEKMSIAQLLKNIVSGKGVVRHKIIFIEGWTFHQIKEALSDDANLRHLIKNKTNQEIMQMLGQPKQHPEGQFFPDTYQFIWGNTDIDILKHAHEEMQQVLNNAWQKREPNLPYRNKYQALIVASMVEKESPIPHERRLIAGVILRRLKKRMRLQVDPTVLYGVNKPFGTPITKSDLRKKTPYNTYRVYGLPPTPIDMPSLDSIRAALNPTMGNYLYYVARGDGSHVFSETYREHLLAVKKLRAYQSQNQEQEQEKSAQRVRKSSALTNKKLQKEFSELISSKKVAREVLIATNILLRIVY